jgi:GGDEF domain-containing protein
MYAHRFTLVNDQNSFFFSKIYLKILTDPLKASIPQGWLISRLGGDEFGMLLEG